MTLCPNSGHFNRILMFYLHDCFEYLFHSWIQLCHWKLVSIFFTSWSFQIHTASFMHPPAPASSPFHGLQVEICSTMDLHGLQGDSLPYHGPHHRLQGKTLCSGISSTSSLSFFTDLGVCRVVSLTLSHSSLSTAIFSLQFFFPLLKYVVTEADWVGLGQKWVRLRADWHCLYQTWGKLVAASHRSYRYSPHATKTLPCKPVTGPKIWNLLSILKAILILKI